MASDFEHLEEQLREANEELNRRSGRPLIAAILTGLVIGAVVIVGVFVKPVLIPVATAAAVAGAAELANALRPTGRRVPRIPVIALAAVAPSAGYFLGAAGLWWTVLGGLAVVWVWRLVESALGIGRGGARGSLLRDLAAAALVIVYVIFLAAWSMVLHAEPQGEWWLLGCLVVVVANDTGAYVVGLNLGRHPMAPTISPKKSWEGFAGGIAASVIAGVLISTLLWQQPWWLGVVAGLLFLGTGTMGDLAESLIKRDIGIKDMSGWMPGHGGVLDRLDSVLVSLPFAFGLYLISAG